MSFAIDLALRLAVFETIIDCIDCVALKSGSMAITGISLRISTLELSSMGLDRELDFLSN
jgi:hypothetical protein